MVRVLVLGLVLVLLLGGCRPFPLSANVDLLERTTLDREGRVTITVEEGEVGTFDRREPDDDGTCVPLEGEGWRPTIHAAQVRYDVRVRYDGPPLRGRVSGSAYVAPAREELWQAPARLGPETRLDLARTSTRLNGTLTLGPRQLQALRERVLCWGAVLRGHDVVAEGSGQAHVDYELERLELSIRYGVF